MTLMPELYHDLLTAIGLSQDPLHHASGEHGLWLARHHPHYPLLLTRAAGDQSLTLGDRQMAYALLKRLVREDWDSDGISGECKTEIRNWVLYQLRALAHCTPLLTQCSALIGAIAEYDLPTNQWPDLLPVLLRSLSIPSLASASIYCISLLVRDLPQDHLVDLSKYLYPILTQIFGDLSSPELLRYQSICIFSELVDSISCADEEQRDDLRCLLNPFVPIWLQMVRLLFLHQPHVGSLHFALCIESCDLIAAFTRSVLDRDSLGFSEVLQCILNFASSLLPLYEIQYIDAQQDDCGFEVGVERCTLSHFFTSVSDLFAAITWPISHEAFQFILVNFEEIVQMTLVTLQVPYGEEPMFEGDLDYVTSYTARSASKDLISRLPKLFAVLKAPTPILEQYCRACLSTKTLHWKVLEVGLFILGQLVSIPEDIVPTIAHFALNSNPHVRIRSLYVLKQFIPSYERHTDSVVLAITNACAANLSHECEAVRLAAADCISVIPAKGIASIGGTLLTSLMHHICGSIISARFQTHIATFLNAIQTLLDIDQLRRSSMKLVSRSLMKVWSKHIHDSVVTTQLTRILEIFCVQDTIRSMQSALIPTVVAILQHCDGAASEALITLLSKLVLPCEDKHLPDELCDLVAPRIVQILSHSGEARTVSSCVDCLSSIIRNGTKAAANSVSIIMPAVCGLLQKKSLVIFVGHLIYTVVDHHSDRFQEEDIRLLLVLLHERVVACNAPPAMVADSLLAIGKIIRSFHAANILQLLIDSTLPEQLAHFFQKWVELYDGSIPSDFKSLTLLALSEVAQVRRPELDAVMVSGYPVVGIQVVSCTRSPDPVTSVIQRPILLTSKIISVLVSHLRSSDGLPRESSDSSESEATLDQFELNYFDDSGNDYQRHPPSFFSTLDPMDSIDLSIYVPEFIREFFFSQPEAATCFFQQLSENDQNTVQQCLHSAI